jgi:hypothetical protein
VAVLDNHVNLAVSTVATAPSPATSGTSLVVAAAEGARFPAVPFNATVWPAGAAPTPANAEIVRVTARATDTLTIARAQEGTAARTVVAGDQLAATVTAKTLTDIETQFLQLTGGTLSGALLLPNGAAGTPALAFGSDTDLGLYRSAADTLAVNGTLAAKTGSAATFLVAAYNASARVKAQADYVCDNTGDQVEINAAITALPTRGGKVLLSEGNFSVTGPVKVNRDNVVLEGMGHGTPAAGGGGDDPVTGGTALAPTAGFTGGTAVVVCALDAPNRALHGVQLRDFAIMGFNGPASLDGIYWQVTWGACERLYVTYMTGRGFYSTAYDDDVLPYPAGTHAPYDCFFNNLRFRTNTGHGMVFDNTTTDHIFFGCVIDQNGGDGLKLFDALGSSTALQIHGCYIYSNEGCGIRANTWQLKLYDTRVQDNHLGGLYLTGTWGGGFQIVGGNYRNNSIAADNTYDAINIAPTAAVPGGLISGVDFYADVGLDNAALTRQRYGINVANANMQDLVIGPCSSGFKEAASVFGTAFLNDAGTGTRVLTPEQMKLADGATIQVGTTTGTKLGTATTQKLGFFNATPVVQPGNTTDLRQALIDLGLYAGGGITPLNLAGGSLVAGTVSVFKDGGLASLSLTSYGTGNYGYIFATQARGTFAAPLRVKTGDTLIRFTGTGAYAADDASAATLVTGGRASVSVVVAQDWTATVQSAYLRFDATPFNSTTTSEAARLGDQGQGLDFFIGHISSWGVRLKNNQTVVSRTASGSANVELFKFNASDRFELLGDTQITDAKNVVLGTTTGTKLGTATTQKLGFFNATPVVQPGAYTQTYATADKTHAALTAAALTHSVGTADGTVADVGASFSQTILNNNFRDLSTQVNNLVTDLTDVKQLVNALIDDLQALGLVG